MHTFSEFYSARIDESFLNKYEKEANKIAELIKGGDRDRAVDMLTDVYNKLLPQLVAAEAELKKTLETAARANKLQNFSIATRIKPLKSTINKVIDRKKKLSALGDLVAGSIYAREEDAPKKLYDHIRRKMKVVDFEAKEKGGDKVFGYYGTYHLGIELPSGVIGEIQLMTKKMSVYKDAAHAIYSANRAKAPGDVAKGDLQQSKKFFHIANSGRRVREALEELGIDDFAMLESMVNALFESDAE